MASSVRSRLGRTTADKSEVSALRGADPTLSPSPYHAFSRAPSVMLGRPRRWPGAEGFATAVRLLWDDQALYVCWELEGSTEEAIDAACLEPAVLGGLEGGRIPTQMRSVLLDERVECFLWQPDGTPTSVGQTYYAFEINFDGKALTNRAKFNGEFDFHWDSSGAFKVWTSQLAVGHCDSASPLPTAEAPAPAKRVVIGEFRWRAMNIDPEKEIRIGLHRAQHPPAAAGARHLTPESASALLRGMIWTTFVDPDDEEVNFHRSALFAKLVLQPMSADINCSCSAARLFSSKALQVVASPQPLLDECPPGSVLIRTRYASLCGSDIPYFRDMASRAASCYWDRDGFCGHEVVGEVLESSSQRFAKGDSVLSLPSSYFKAHVATQQEWYEEEVHGVLLTNFPVRGGFSEIFTSHELYTYKIEECVPRMLAAQALGTLLRMFRRLGPFFGKTVAILGQGQNGLMATRLVSQLCARYILAVEPLAFRRRLAEEEFGATKAVAPEDAAAAVAAATGGRGADVVLEMVGHNQATINDALELVAKCGTIASFGVPDDAVYESFQFAKFFRKNVTLMASVIPDPGVDFPQAVELIERGSFSTEGVFTHVLPLAKIQRAFTLASEYRENVVKVVIDMQ